MFSTILFKIRALARTFEADWALRFPEGRYRRCLEVETTVKSLSESQKAFLARVRQLQGLIGLWDWGTLWEIHERLSILLYAARIQNLLNTLGPDLALRQAALQKRLSALAEEIQSEYLTEVSSTVDLIRARWKGAARREEADYLMDRLESLRASNKAAAA